MSSFVERRDRGVGLVDVDLDRRLGDLIVEVAELAGDLIDLELHLLELVLHDQGLTDRGRLVHQPIEDRSPGRVDLQMCLRVDVVGGDVLPLDLGGVHRAELAQLQHRLVEVGGRDPQRERAAVAARGGGGQDRAAVGAGDRDHALELVAEAPVRDRHGDRAVADDLGEIRQFGALLCRALVLQPGARPGSMARIECSGHRSGGAADAERCFVTARAVHRCAHRAELAAWRTNPRTLREDPDPERERQHGRRRAEARAEVGPAAPRLGGRRHPSLLGARDLGQVRLQLLQDLELRLHHSTSVTRLRPRSCSTIAMRRSPRLTR